MTTLPPHVILALLSLLLTPVASNFCPQHCACNDTSLSVRCPAASNLKLVPIFLNPDIKALSLSNNQIQEVTLSFQFYQKLSSLDISANKVSSLGHGNFELKDLVQLNVSYNQVKALESRVFQGLNSLLLLDISGNQIERIEQDVFWGLTKVREIRLDRNRLEFIDWEIFRGLDALQRLSIQYNFIQVIEATPSKSGFTLPLLQSLDVSSNQLTRVKDSSLQTFPYLKDLNLCCNYIHTLEEKAFTQLERLERVNLSQNRLGTIPSKSLFLLGKTLRALDLSSNRVTDELPAGAFKGLSSLQTLRLNDNPGLLSFHPQALEEQVGLVNFEADFLHNVTSFSGTLLANKPGLRRFSMKYAGIWGIPPDLLQDLDDPTAKSLDLTGNPIECNCSAWPLFQYLQNWEADESDFFDFPEGQSQIQQPYVDQSGRKSGKLKGNSNKRPFFLSTIRCQNPPNLSGILVKDLKSSDFSDCFTTEDHFQFLVICIAAVLLSFIFLIIGVKLCCFSGDRGWSCKGWGKWRKACSSGESGRKFCGKGCPCFGGVEKDVGSELDYGKRDVLFEGFNRGRAEIQPNFLQGRGGEDNPFVGIQVTRSPSGKLFFSADNSTPHHHLYQSQPNTHLEENPYYHPPIARPSPPIHMTTPTKFSTTARQKGPPPLPPYNGNCNYQFTMNPAAQMNPNFSSATFSPKHLQTGSSRNKGYSNGYQFSGPSSSALDYEPDDEDSDTGHEYTSPIELAHRFEYGKSGRKSSGSGRSGGGRGQVPSSVLV